MVFEDNIYQEVLRNLCDGIRFIGRDKKITFWNRGAELITGFKHEEVSGTSCGDRFRMHFSDCGGDICGGNCPVTNVFETGQTQEMQAYVKHKEGYLVPVMVCASPIVNSEGSVVGVIEMFNDISWKMAALQRIEELSRMTSLDALTEIGNRRFAERTIESKLDEMKRHDVPFGVLFIDVDDFKTVNDAYGHGYGDRMLKNLTRSISGCLRLYDHVCRWGGDEFVVIVNNLSDSEHLGSLASRIRAVTSQSSLVVAGVEVTPSVSIGATFAQVTDSVSSLVSRADALMYRSKVNGKRCITVG